MRWMQQILALASTAGVIAGIVLILEDMAQLWLGVGIVTTGCVAAGLGVTLARLELLRAELRDVHRRLDDIERNPR